MTVSLTGGSQYRSSPAEGRWKWTPRASPRIAWPQYGKSGDRGESQNAKCKNLIFLSLIFLSFRFVGVRGSIVKLTTEPGGGGARLKKWPADFLARAAEPCVTPWASAPSEGCDLSLPAPVYCELPDCRRPSPAESLHSCAGRPAVLAGGLVRDRPQPSVKRPASGRRIREKPAENQ